MSEINNLMNDIESLRKNLYEMINKKNVNLSDPDVVTASEMLNAAILKYIEIINKKMK